MPNDIILRSKSTRDTGFSLIELTMVMALMMVITVSVFSFFDPSDQTNGHRDGGVRSGHTQGMTQKPQVKDRPSPTSMDITNDDMF